MTLAGFFENVVMKDNTLRPSSKNPPEASRDKHVNYFAEDDDESIDAGNEKRAEAPHGEHGRDRKDDAALNEILQIEIRIDPGNEHHHRTDADDKIFDEDIDRSPRYEADTTADGTGTLAPEPDE